VARGSGMNTAIELSNSDLPFIEITVYYKNQNIRLPQVLRREHWNVICNLCRAEIRQINI
jgi:hypothetical protein